VPVACNNITPSASETQATNLCFLQFSDSALFTSVCLAVALGWMCTVTDRNWHPGDSTQTCVPPI